METGVNILLFVKKRWKLHHSDKVDEHPMNHQGMGKSKKYRARESQAKIKMEVAEESRVMLRRNC